MTIPELEALPSLLIGIADDFHQVIHNANQAHGALAQGNGKGHEELDATGTILGSELRFFFHYVEEFNPSTGIHTFRGARINIG